MHWLTVFFGWPDGGVWSNLLSSAIAALGIYFRAKAKLAQVLGEHRRQLAEQLTAHHEALLAAVTEKGAGQ